MAERATRAQYADAYPHDFKRTGWSLGYAAYGYNAPGRGTSRPDIGHCLNRSTLEILTEWGFWEPAQNDPPKWLARSKLSP